MKVNIDSDEWYPVHYITDSDYGTDCELSDEDVSFVNKAFEDFTKAQGILYEAIQQNERN